MRSIADRLNALTGNEIDTEGALEELAKMEISAIEVWNVRIKDPNDPQIKDAIRQAAALKKVIRQTRYLLAKGVEVKAGLHFINEFKNTDAVLQKMEEFFPGYKLAGVKSSTPNEAE